MLRWVFMAMLAFYPLMLQAASGYSEVNTNQLKQLIETTPQLMIIDARTPEHDNGQRIENAIVLPYNAEQTLVTSLLPKKDAPIVVYCWSMQCPMAGYMVDRLVSMGYSKVYKYPEGLSVWIEEMGPITTVEK